MGKKNSIYVIKIHTNRDQTLNIYTKRPASPTCNLYGSLPRRGEGAARGGGGWGQILCCYVFTVVVAGWVTQKVVGTVL